MVIFHNSHLNMVFFHSSQGNMVLFLSCQPNIVIFISSTKYGDFQHNMVLFLYLSSKVGDFSVFILGFENQGEFY